MPTGGTITISAKHEVISEKGFLKPGRYVRLSIDDEGEGMDEATLSRAIEPFFTTKGIGKGTGLGVPMVHGFAEQSGGKFVLKSQLGQGTTAELWLVVSTEAAPQRADDREVKRDLNTSPLRVLAVDDDTLVLANTATMLQELGHEVEEAGSGADALNALREDSFDLLLTDYAMPGMNGEELAKIVREEHPELPILMVSGYADLSPGLASEAVRLAKPFSEEALAAAIAEVVNEQSSPTKDQIN
jgi:CheY-like chemotaxis protein